MTDEELVKMARLAQRDDRMSTGALYGDLADRIEELEAKLAKAVEALRKIEGWPDYRSPSHQDIARTTLAEIEGGK